MDADGIMISTSAITAVVGSGGIGAWIATAIARRRAEAARQSQCDHCPDHERLVNKVAGIEVQTVERIARMQADIANICRSVDELRADVKELMRTRV